MAPAECGKFASELKECLLFRGPVPIEPRYLVVLAIGVVVALLRSTKLVATSNHRYTLRQEEPRSEISFLTLSQVLNFLIVSGPFGAAVPSIVIIIAFLVSLPFRSIWFIVILHV